MYDNAIISVSIVLVYPGLVAFGCIPYMTVFENEFLGVGIPL